MKNTVRLKDNLEEFESKMSNTLLTLWNSFQEDLANGLDYNELGKWQEQLGIFGLTFDYGLDAEPYDFELTIK